MNDRIRQNINNHIKNKFSNNEKIEILKSFPNKKEIEDNKIYQMSFSCIAIDIVDSKRKLDEFSQEEWSKILSEFAYGITKIMNEYGAKYIKIQGDSVYGIFETKNQNDIDNILDCCVELNTFKRHLNKQIYKILFKKHSIDYGIGAWYSSNNYIYMIGKNSSRDIVFLGDSVNYANALSKLARRKNINEEILFNKMMLNNFSNEYKNINKHIWQFQQMNKMINNEKIYGCDWKMTKYHNWVENNI